MEAQKANDRGQGDGELEQQVEGTVVGTMVYKNEFGGGRMLVGERADEEGYVFFFVAASNDDRVGWVGGGGGYAEAVPAHVEEGD